MQLSRICIELTLAIIRGDRRWLAVLLLAYCCSMGRTVYSGCRVCRHYIVSYYIALYRLAWYRAPGSGSYWRSRAHTALMFQQLLKKLKLSSSFSYKIPNSCQRHIYQNVALFCCPNKDFVHVCMWSLSVFGYVCYRCRVGWLCWLCTCTTWSPLSRLSTQVSHFPFRIIAVSTGHQNPCS